MKRISLKVRLATLAVAAIGGFQVITSPNAPAQAPAPNAKAVQRSRQTVQTLDNIFKQTIVLVTDKYVNDDDDFAAGSAAVLLFKNISEGSDNTIRLIDATGDPYDSDNVAKDDFEKSGIKKLKAGAKTVDQVVVRDGKHYLRALTPVPVVMQKCVMCHAHYADAKPGEPIGAISYTVPIQ
ncbi:c-type heme family protein [Rosistilla oblonga]|uniref:Tll0287-like domain-containing protein n=1 Tax=Rosistilla oblonga TaxID=2527990 RepID=A0A518IXJ7_9BACT|nr:DUF3365 domain-containing protein [Rosistilla oblonga]QDV57811.1 hypothetical protein Mal33_38260 [Rosistilla oblonga]